MLTGIVVLALLGAAPQALAAPPPGCPTPEYHQLDFWIGDWDAYEPEIPGAAQARAHIDPILGHCAIHEVYEQVDGLIGDSVLSFDAVRKVWQQTWITNRGSLMVIQGAFKDGTLTLEGEMHGKDGKAWLQRISWKAEDKGVHEWAVRSGDGGKTWEPAFDVHFLKHRR